MALVVCLAATILSLPGEADGIHCAAGMLLLAGCGLHLAWHGRWIRAVVLRSPQNIPPGLRQQRGIFRAALLSGLLCGASGLLALLSVPVILPALCLLAPLHTLSGLAFLGLAIYHLALHRNWFTARVRRIFIPAGK